MSKNKINSELLNRMQLKLHDDEEVLWVEKGDVLHVMFKADVMFRLAGVIILYAIALYIDILLTDDLFVFLFMAFILLSIPTAKFLSMYLKASNTLYAITDQRIIIKERNSTKTYQKDDLQFIKRKMIDRDKGDIIFDYTDVVWGDGLILKSPVGFFGIQNVRQVEALVLRIFNIGNFSK